MTSAMLSIVSVSAQLQYEWDHVVRLVVVCVIAVWTRNVSPIFKQPALLQMIDAASVSFYWPVLRP